MYRYRSGIINVITNMQDFTDNKLSQNMKCVHTIIIVLHTLFISLGLGSVIYMNQQQIIIYALSEKTKVVKSMLYIYIYIYKQV